MQTLIELLQKELKTDNNTDQNHSGCHPLFCMYGFILLHLLKNVDIGLRHTYCTYIHTYANVRINSIITVMWYIIFLLYPLLILSPSVMGY